MCLSFRHLIIQIKTAWIDAIEIPNLHFKGKHIDKKTWIFSANQPTGAKLVAYILFSDILSE